ncbi:beta-lactamase/transpeptidase-like protein [Aspergillus granulosus]|uniref:Beta-lactamase/transpeptidase-like protein n=1 Tax=Aspergillus granulosus TaxID=176169 RepID=A0ABR4H954_9EURO
MRRTRSHRRHPARTRSSTRIYNPKGPDLTTVPATGQITLRHLLSHTSGLAYDVFEPNLAAWRASKGEGSLSFIGDVFKTHTVPLMFNPGASFVYGWTGELVARLNNTKLEGYLQEHIFQPLRMDSTTFRLKQHPNIAKRMYPMFARQDNRVLTASQNPWPAEPSADCAGAGFYSSVGDFMKILMTSLAKVLRF